MTSGLCTGCAGCIVACPHDVLGYDDTNGVYRPFHLDEDGGAGRLHPRGEGLHHVYPGLPALSELGDGDRHVPLRTRAPRRRGGRDRRETSSSRGRRIPAVRDAGQDGGLVSAILIWALEHDRIDAALVSALEGDGTSWKAVPAVARTREEILDTAGSRYTYSANTLAYPEAIEAGAERIALVGMSCQASVPAGHVGPQGREGGAPPGAVDRAAVLQDLRRRHLPGAVRGPVRPAARQTSARSTSRACSRSGPVTVGTTRCRSKRGTRGRGEGCKACPDFAAEHADISTGGIGAFNDWTLTIVRTDQGREHHRRHDRRRCGRDPARRRRPGCHRAAAQAGARQPSSVARDRGRLAAAPALFGLTLAPAVGPSGSGASAAGRRDRLGCASGIERVSRVPPSTRARVKTASNMGSVSVPVNVFCWLGWYEHSDRQATGRGRLDPVAEARPGTNAELGRHHLVGELAEGHHDARRPRAAPAPAAGTADTCRVRRWSARSSAVRSARRRSRTRRAARARRRAPRWWAGWPARRATGRRTASPPNDRP